MSTDPWLPFGGTDFLSLRLSRLLASITSLLLLTIATQAAPIVFGPTMIDGDGQAGFIFSEDMEDSMDITWSGNGIDASKITCAWVQSPIPNIPFPQQLLNCTYAGGWPGGVEVTWTVNAGNSGVMKSKAGESAPAESGNFMTPGTPDPDPDPDPGNAPECGGDHTPLPFPKRVNLCGPDIQAWSSALVVPTFSDDRYSIIGSSDASESLVMLDAQGMTQWSVYTDESDLSFGIGASANIVTVHGARTSVGQFVFGAYDTAADLSPVFQTQTPITSAEHSIVSLPDGRIAVMQAFDGRVELFVLGADGQLDWGKTYESPRFEGTSAIGGFGLGLSRTSRVTSGPNNTFLIAVTQTENTSDGATFTSNHDVTLVNVSSNGTTNWSKTYTGFSGTTAPVVIGTEDAIYFTSFNTDASNPISPVTTSTLHKLDSQGNLSWGREFTDGIVGYSWTLPNGNTILVGSITEISGLNFDVRSVVILLNGNGAIDKVVEFDLGEESVALPVLFAGKDQIFISLIGADSSGATPAVYGVADHQLNSFKWKTYGTSAEGGTLIPNPEVSGAILSAFNAETHQVDTFKVTDSLTAEGDCPVFEEATAIVTSTNITNTSSTLASVAAAVSESALFPTFTDTTIAVQSVDLDEESLCTDGSGGGSSDPGARGGTLAIRSTGADSGVLEFLSEVGKNYIIERSLTLLPATWTEFQTVSGNGGAVSLPLNYNPSTAFFRLLNGN